MVLICKYCQHEIKEGSKRCPNCGMRLKEFFSSINSAFISSIIIFVVSLSLIILCLSLKDFLIADHGIFMTIISVTGIFLLPILFLIVYSSIIYFVSLILIKTKNTLKNNSIKRDVKVKCISNIVISSLTIGIYTFLMIWILVTFL